MTDLFAHLKYLCGQRNVFLLNFDPVKYLCLRDVRLTSYGLEVQLKISKTNQFGDKNIILPMYELHDSPLCPIRAFKLMCQLVPAPPDAPAFCYLEKGSLIPIHAPLLDRYLKRFLKAGEVPNAECLTMHSFRRGGASFYFNSGVPGEIIQLFGNWASDCYLRYLRFTRESLLDAAYIVSRSVPRF